MRSFKRAGVVHSLFCTSLTRVMSALGGFLVVAVFGNIYGPKGVGLFAIFQSLYFGLSVLSRFGLDNALVKFVGISKNSETKYGYFSLSFKLVVMTSFLLSVVFFIARSQVVKIFGIDGLSENYIYMVAMVPLLSLSMLMSGYLKGVNRSGLAGLLENGFICLLATPIIFILEKERPMELGNIGVALVVSASLVVFFSYFVLGIKKRKVKITYIEAAERSSFISTSSDFFLISLSQLGLSVISILVAGAMLSEHDLGLFKVAERVAFVVGFVMVIINSVFPVRFAKSYNEGDFKNLATLLKKSSLCGLFLSLPLAVLFFVFHEKVLLLFGNEFLDARGVMYALVLSQLFNVITGPVGYLLVMAGEGKLMRNVSLASNFLGILLMIFFAEMFGLNGIVAAVIILVFSQNSLATYFVWSRLGISILAERNCEKV